MSRTPSGGCRIKTFIRTTQSDTRTISNSKPRKGRIYSALKHRLSITKIKLDMGWIYTYRRFFLDKFWAVILTHTAVAPTNTWFRVRSFFSREDVSLRQFYLLPPFFSEVLLPCEFWNQVEVWSKNHPPNPSSLYRLIYFKSWFIFLNLIPSQA